MRLTVPQIIMLNHAAFVNQKRSEARVKTQKDGEERVSYNGKDLGDLTTDELAAYFGGVSTA